MSFLICSVMGIGLTASGEMNLVKMVTASFSIPEKETRSSSFLHNRQLLQGMQSKSMAGEEKQSSSGAEKARFKTWVVLERSMMINMIKRLQSRKHKI